MKFKEYLLEYTKYSIEHLISIRAVPLVPSMLDRLGYVEDNLEVYHLTNQRDLENLVKHQNKRSQISCFTSGGYELARLPSQPNVLLKLKGKAIIKGEKDLWSLVSVKGRRWLDQDARIKGNKITFGINGILQKIANNLGIDVDMYKISNSDLEKLINSLDKKTVYYYGGNKNFSIEEIVYVLKQLKPSLTISCGSKTIQ